jgi:hypothetical protein
MRRVERNHRSGTVHQVLVYDGDHCVGWCQFARRRNFPTSKSRRTYDQGADDPPDWRIGCAFTNAKARGKGVSAGAVAAALDEIRRAGGGGSNRQPTRRTQRVSVSHTGLQATESSYGTSISADGRYIVLSSNDSTLVPGDTNGIGDLFIRDLRAGTTIRINVSSTRAQSEANAGNAASSGRGPMSPSPRRIRTCPLGHQQRR